MSVRSAKQKSRTKKNTSTTKTRLSAPRKALVDGTDLPYVFSWQRTDGKSSVLPATKLKPDEKTSVGLKHDNGKPSLAYIPKAALYAEGRAFAFGAAKYNAWNYKNGISITRTLSAALRHIVQFLAGEDIDTESGSHHLGCARANIAMALDTLENHPSFDDRFKKGTK